MATQAEYQLLETTVDELKHLFTPRVESGETVLLNMGPQHPSTHGVLRLMVELDGETVVTAAWQEKIPLFTGYTLLVDLSVSTADK